LNQTGFAAHLVEQFCRDTWKPTPTATPYHLGIPIDLIACSSDDYDSPSQLRRTEAYQSLIGSIGWLATATRPNLAPVHSFLSSYNSKPSTGHMKVALHVLHYIHSTHNYGIHFTSSDTNPIHTFVHFPDSSDVEAYTDAKPPSPSHSSPLTLYSDAPACSRTNQSCRYLHEGNAGWCSFLAHARFFHVSTVQLTSAVSFRCSSLAPAGRAPPTAGCTFRGFLVCVCQQGFISFGIMLLSVISDLGRDLTSFQCRSSYHPVASLSCAFCTDLIFSNPPGLDSVFFFQSRTQGWGVLICPWSGSFL